MTLIDRIAQYKALGMNAYEIATIVERPVKQVQDAMRVIKHPDEEAKRQASYYERYKKDPAYVESRREYARKYQAERRKDPAFRERDRERLAERRRRAKERAAP